MPIDAQERVEDDTETMQWATKSYAEALSGKFEALLLEVVKLQVGQKWIAWILGVMCAVLVAIFCALIAIDLQI